MNHLYVQSTTAADVGRITDGEIGGHMSSNSCKLSRAVHGALFGAAFCAALGVPVGTLRAQEAATAGTQGLEEIIVTAQKREQSLKDVPVTLSVVDDALIRDTGARTFADLIPMVPAVSGFTTGVATSVWAIRGLSSNTTDGGGEPSVGFYWDESYAGYPEFANAPLFDVARIEVAKGPQGTLYGKNASAGAISAYTNRPDTGGDSLDVNVGAGNLDQLRGELRGNLAVNDKLALRLSGMYDRRGDYQTNMVLGGKLGSYDRWGGRLGALWRPTDAVEVYGYYERWEANSDQWATNTQSLTGDTNPNHVYSTLKDLRDDIESNIAHVEVNWDINDRWKFKSISDYRDSHYSWETDAAAIPVPMLQAITTAVFHAPMTSILALQLGGPNSRMYQQEFRLSWQGDSVFAVTGINYNNYRTEFPKTGAQLGLDPLGVRRVDWTGFVGPRDSLGLFADGTWEATDRLSLTAGLRYSRDKRDWTSYANSDTYLLPAPNAAVPIDFVTGTSRLPIVASGCVQNLLAPCLGPKGLSASKTDDDFTPRVAFTYKLTDDLNVYGGISRGYKAGGFNTATDGQHVIGYEPETATAYELGLKGQSSTLRYGIALFDTEFKNLQVQSIVNAVVFTTNAAEARTKGVEADLTWQAADALQIFANYTYLDAKYTKGEISCGSGCLTDAKGLHLIRAPQNQANVGVNLSGDLGDFGTLAFIPRFHYQSSQELNIWNAASFHEDGYSTLDARLTLTPVSKAWDVSLVGENLTGQKIIQRIWDPLGFGATLNYRPTEALYRLEFGMKFGNAK